MHFRNSSRTSWRLRMYWGSRQPVLLAVRQWRADSNRRDATRLRGGRAASSVVQPGTTVAQMVPRRVPVRWLRWPGLRCSRARLLRRARLPEDGESVLAERTLRTALLSTSGADFALGPLLGLGQLLAGARVLLRKLPVVTDRLDSVVLSRPLPMPPTHPFAE